jgi:hypothetical protein
MCLVGGWLAEKKHAYPNAIRKVSILNLLGKPSIDVVVDLSDLVGRMNSNGRCFTVFDLGKGCHDFGVDEM